MRPNIYTLSKLALYVLTAIACARACCSTAYQPQAPDLHTCNYSNQVYDSDASLLRQRVPHFNLMASRYLEFVEAARGYHCTGTVSIAFNGHNYIQAGMGDDPGIAELIATLSSLAGISLAAAYDLTEFAVISLGILIGYAGFWRLCPDQGARWLGAGVFLCLGLVEAKVADVYIFQASPLIAGIPWVVHFGLSRRPYALNVSAVLLAFSCSWCSLVRIGTTLICMVFLITLFTTRSRVQRISLPLLLISIACLPSMIFEHNRIARRDAVLASVGETPRYLNNHMLWHSIYIGFAFVPNSEVPVYLDKVGVDKVRSVDPTVSYSSGKYEAILRREVFDLARQRPWLIIANLAAKTAIVALLALIILFPVRRVLFADREVLWLDAAFVVAIGVSAIGPILVVPRPPCLLTFVCLTCLYSSIKLWGCGLQPSWNRTAVAHSTVRHDLRSS